MFTVVNYRDTVLIQLNKRCCHLLVPLPSWCWHLPARQCVHHARKTIKLLQRETPKFISPDWWMPNSPNLNLAIITYRAWCRIVCIRHKFKTWPTWDNAWLTLGVASRKALWEMPLMNSVRDFRPEWMKREAILNTCCNTRTLLCRKTR